MSTICNIKHSQVLNTDGDFHVAMNTLKIEEANQVALERGYAYFSFNTHVYKTMKRRFNFWDAMTGFQMSELLAG